MIMNSVIEVNHLRKTYGSVTAVDDISLQVSAGEIFAIVGPNGAGKTTAVESIMGLRRPDSGEIRVLGLNPQTQGRELKQRIGIQLQQAALPNRLKVWEALDLFATFYGRSLPWEPLLEAWGLTEKRSAQFGKLSGGQKQRLFIALALLNDPEVVFLDELTTGLDPQARHATWDAVLAIRDQGKTVVLVTHFMEEAEELADRLAIIDGGKVVACGTPQALIQELQAGSRVRFTSQNGFDAAVLRPLPGVTQVEQHGRHITVHGRGPLLSHVVTALTAANQNPVDLHVEQANLEDVFLALTGRKIRV
ncbi:MAG: ABC transporter ATP-binding protein [Ardenticatenaceae bacterium]|nr:ABC transporter ATP-binding protein [Ardenticatenaceae bacterium]